MFGAITCFFVADTVTAAVMTGEEEDCAAAAAAGGVDIVVAGVLLAFFAYGFLYGLFRLTAVADGVI